MVYRPFQAAGTQSEAAYGRQMMVEGHSYRERQKGQVKCRECGEEMAAGSLAGNRMTQHGQAAEGRWISKTLVTGEDPRTYCMDFLSKGDPRSCSVEGCPGQAATRTAIRVHFIHLHVLYTVVILEEGNIPHPRCHQCDKMLPWRKSHFHRTVRQGIGSEEAAVSGRGIEGDHGEVL